ncbi:MAG: hypothetical protein ACRDID_09955 [Ktedonobacterales bacterium]
MAARMSELEPRTLERLRAELAELIAVTVAYPPYYDFRANRLVTRPIDRARMDEIQRYLSSVNFGPLERADVSSVETRRFIERLVTRYLEVNGGMHGRYVARALPRLRAMAPRVAAEAQQRALGYMSGSTPDFGARRQTISWTSVSRRAPTRSDEDRERAARMLETGLMQRVSASQALPAIGQSDAGAHSRQPSAPDPWRGLPDDVTIPVPAADFAQASGGGSSYAAFGASAPQAPSSPPSRLSEQPTGPLAAAPFAAPTPPTHANHANHAPMRELPPDLTQLYGDYLNDIESAAPARPAAATPPQRAPHPPPPPRPAARPQPQGDTNSRNDQLIFWQLRYQLEAYVRRAARSYGVPHQGGDPATVLDELRRSGFVDEADLRIAEGIFALTDRVTAQGHASPQDYSQALMLYLLYHRSHLSL